MHTTYSSNTSGIDASHMSAHKGAKMPRMKMLMMAHFSCLKSGAHRIARRRKNARAQRFAINQHDDSSRPFENPPR
jgi:hypothetical protein